MNSVTLHILFPIVWAIGCWQLRAHFGDLAVVGVRLGSIALFLTLTGIPRLTAPMPENPNRVADFADNVNLTDFTFMESATPEQVPVFADLTSAFYSVEEPVTNRVGYNVMLGQLNRDDVVVFDLKTKGSAQIPYQTLVVFTSGCKGLPPFELFPNTRGAAWFGAQGFPSFDPSNLFDKADRQRVRTFVKHYWLTAPDFDIAAAPAGTDTEIEKLEAAMEEDEAAIRRLFTLDVLSFFAATPGWFVQAQKGHLLVCRPGQHYQAEERVALLAEAHAILQLLTGRPMPSDIIVPGLKHGFSWGGNAEALLSLHTIVIVFSGFLGGLAGFLGGLLALFFGGHLWNWFLVGCAVGVMYGPLLWVVFFIVMWLYYRTREVLIGERERPDNTKQPKGRLSDGDAGGAASRS